MEIITSNKKIIVIDDDEDILDFVSICLEDDYKLTLAEEGEQALKFVEREPFDLMIVDIYLPKIDGATLIKEIRKKYNTPILAISGYLTRNQYLNEALTLGATDFMEKPFTVGELLNTVSGLMVKQA